MKLCDLKPPPKVTLLVFLAWPECGQCPVPTSRQAPQPPISSYCWTMRSQANRGTPTCQAYHSKGPEITSQELRAKARTSFWSRPNSLLCIQCWLIFSVPQTTVQCKRIPLKTNSSIYWIIYNKLLSQEKLPLNSF